METFDNDEEGYLRWIAANPNGFVINAEKSGSNPFLMLHRASCIHIARGTHRNYTTTTYKKICSMNVQELVYWAYKNSSKFQECKICMS